MNSRNRLVSPLSSLQKKILFSSSIFMALILSFRGKRSFMPEHKFYTLSRRFENEYQTLFLVSRVIYQFNFRHEKRIKQTPNSPERQSDEKFALTKNAMNFSSSSSSSKEAREELAERWMEFVVGNEHDRRKL